MFTSADVAALADAAGLLTAGMLDPDGLVELARPFGHLLSRLSAAQTSFLSDVLGARIAAGHLAEDPASGEHMAGQAVLITQELLPVLERTTVYVWRRHLAAEAGRALLLAATGWDERVADRRSAVGFIDISGYTRLSRHLDLADVAVLLERFETVVGDTVLPHGGRVTKNLGDEVLFVTEDPASAAEITLGLLEQIDTDPDLARSLLAHRRTGIAPAIRARGAGARHRLTHPSQNPADDGVPATAEASVMNYCEIIPQIAMRPRRFSAEIAASRCSPPTLSKYTSMPSGAAVRSCSRTGPSR